MEEGPTNSNEPNSEDKKEVTPQKGFIKMKIFPFVMLLLGCVFATALVTAVVMSVGGDKEVKVSIPDRKEFTKLYNVYDEIQKKYYKDVNTDKMMEGAITGMVASLGDPYSSFMTKKEAEDFDSTISSSFSGIGVEIQEKDGYITVVSPIKNSPAEAAGLRPNDKIVEVDGKSIKGISSTDATTKIRGKKGTSVTLTISRPGTDQPFDVKIVRDEIPIETVYSEMGADKIATVQITTFSENTYSELEKTLKELDKKGMKGLVVDLRGNPGGLLDQAVDIASLFLPDGKVIVQEEAKDGTKQSIKADSSAHNGYKVKVPVTMLIDEGSASASEILAAAARESAGIKLVGAKSFGKGTVQTAAPLSDGSLLKLTVAKWLTPDGEWIHEKGIKPDVAVALPAYATMAIPDPSKTYKEGSFGDDVKTIESMLSALKYNVGKVDGLFDADTTAGVKAFQTASKIKADGIVTGATTTALITAIQKELKANDPQQQKAIELVKEQLK
ncbi:S41 family peptidase [Listeria weihenstephanensis]|uniref:S41 family peptidase n=1 Tax=Listeria weihenstephanensis TaxID=1006155 RepID=A0A841Z9W6_9LIST|nr:S41 family peptidase [Listeria weihenstephanensis]MBC1501392.1 S41 family peptidase [Listeria weihenstephanensis]